jgi:hypothetical protein
MMMRILVIAIVAGCAYLLLARDPAVPPVALSATSGRYVEPAGAPQAGAGAERLEAPIVAPEPPEVPSNAPSSQTLEGHLEQRVIASTQPRAPSSDATWSVANACSNALWNPRQRTLTVAQEQELQARLNQHNVDMARYEREEVGLRQEAFLQAVRSGQTDVLVTTVAGPAISTTEADAANRQAQGERMDQLGQRLGRVMDDWAYTAMGTVAPDMVGRSVIIYTTKEQAPGLFGVRRQMVEANTALHQDMVRFFERIP